MKKSELRKIIREIIKEQPTPVNPFQAPLGSEVPDIQTAQASSIIVNNSNGMNIVPNGGYSIRCPEGYTFEGYEGNTSPGNIFVDAANTPASGFVAIGDYPMFIVARCIKKVGTSMVSTDVPLRHSCDAVQGCIPSSTGPFMSKEECIEAGCGRERPENGELEGGSYLGPTMRPYAGGPLQERKNKRKK